MRELVNLRDDGVGTTVVSCDAPHHFEVAGPWFPRLLGVRDNAKGICPARSSPKLPGSFVESVKRATPHHGLGVYRQDRRGGTRVEPSKDDDSPPPGPVVGSARAAKPFPASTADAAAHELPAA